jgi:hypothetical protein
VLACLGVAAASLLLPAQPTYDPWAWIIWGREILHADLVTTSGPSWKPLPVLFTTPFALAGDVAPQLWVLVARAGGLLALAMTYRLGARLAGRWAGAIAVVALALADEFVRNFARGNSEGLLVALCLWAVERHLDGRRHDALVLGAAAGLLRPEVWPFLALYGLWLMARDRGSRPLVLGAGVLTVLLWFVPEYLGSGNFLRAAERAREANLDSPAYAEHPFLEVFRLSSEILAAPVLAGAVAGVVLAVRARQTVLLCLAAAAAVLMVAVGLMTEAGFAGNLRYVALPAALVCVLAGAGWASLVARVPGRAPRVAVAAVALVAGGALLAEPVRTFDHYLDALRSEADFVAEIPRAAALAGGPDGTNRCGMVVTGRFQVPAVAWHLDRHLDDVEIFGMPPGTALAPRFSALANDPRFAQVGATRKWIVKRTCT